MQKIAYQPLVHTFIFIALLFNPLLTYTYASTNDENTVNGIFKSHGKKNVVNFILKKGNGSITIQKNKSFININGRPELKYITAKSIIHDLDVLDIDIKNLKPKLDKYIENEFKKNKEKNNNLTESASSSIEHGVQLSKQLKYQLRAVQNKYNASDSNSERRRLRKELSILKKAYTSAKSNEQSKLRVYFPDEKKQTKRNSSYCDSKKSQLQKLTGSVYRHQTFFCNDRSYRAKNPGSCGGNRYSRQQSLQDYKSEINQLRSYISKNCKY